MTKRTVKILAPKTMIEGCRLWIKRQDGSWKELSQVNGDGHGAAFYSAFDSREKAIAAARRYCRA